MQELKDIEKSCKHDYKDFQKFKPLNNITERKILSILYDEFPPLEEFDTLFPYKSSNCSEIFSKALYKKLDNYTDSCKGKYIVIKGQFQTWKTLCMISLSIRFWLLGKSSLIILRDYVSDLKQIRDRFITYIHNINNRLGTIVIDPVDIFLEKELSEDEFTDFTNHTNKPKILIFIGHAGNINNYITNNMLLHPENRSNFILLVDEADKMDEKNGKSMLSRQLQILKNNSYCTFGISATILDKLMEERILHNQCIILPNPPHYNGIPQFNHCEITTNVKFTGLKTENILDNDPGIIKFLETISKESPLYSTIYNEYHPIICLINVAKPVIPMLNLVRYIADNYDMVSIGYVGDTKGGIHLYSKHLKNQITLENGVSSIYNNKDNSHVIKGSGISAVYKYLRDNGGTDKFPRIITVCGDLAGRGISFTSGKCVKTIKDSIEDKKMNWHLTDLRLIIAGSKGKQGTDCPECLQKVARLAVVCDDNIRLNLHCTNNTFKLIKQAYNSQEELIERCINIQKEQREKLDNKNSGNIIMDSSMNEIIPNIPMKREKIPTGHRLTKRKNLKIKKVHGSDNGWDLSTYNIETSLKTENVIESGSIYKIYTKDLPDETKEKFDKIIKYLEEYSGLWIHRKDIIYEITKNMPESNRENGLYRSVLHPNNISTKYKTLINDEYCPGLLLKLQSNRWLLRYNLD